MNFESPGDGADGFALADQLAGQILLIGRHFLGASEGDAAGLGGLPAILGSTENKGALKLGYAAEDGRRTILTIMICYLLLAIHHS